MQHQELLATLQRIESHRALHIAGIAANAALDVRMGGLAANDGERGERASTGAD